MSDWTEFLWEFRDTFLSASEIAVTCLGLDEFAEWISRFRMRTPKWYRNLGRWWRL